MRVIEIQEDGLSDAMCYAHKIKKCAEKIGEALQYAMTGITGDEEDYENFPVEEMSSRSRRRHYRMGGEMPMEDDERMYDRNSTRGGSRGRGRYGY